MRFGKVVLLALGATVLIFVTVTAIFWSMTSIWAFPCGQAIPLLGAVGTWVAGLGTFGAAGVALWLGRRTEKVRIKCLVDLRGLLYADRRPAECCVEFEVTNLGILPIIVDTIDWSIGTGRNKKYGIQIILESPLSASLPKRLEHGENANFRVRWKEADMTIWMRDLVRTLGITESNIKTLRARIHTTTGHVEVVKPLKSFMATLADAINSDPTEL